MKKISTAVAKQTNNFREQKLTIGLDLGDRWSWYCMLDEEGEALLEQKLGTTPSATNRSSTNADGRVATAATPVEKNK